MDRHLRKAGIYLVLSALITAGSAVAFKSAIGYFNAQVILLSGCVILFSMFFAGLSLRNSIAFLQIMPSEDQRHNQTIALVALTIAIFIFNAYTATTFFGTYWAEISFLKVYF